MTCYNKLLCRSDGGSATALAITIAVLFGGCAVPVPPTGGPADTDPPVIVSSEPADFDVSTRPERLSIVFSEYINEGSFRQAFTISPELDQLPEISWKKRRVTIRLRSQLRDNTTYIVTVDKSLRDARGVSVQRPLTFAFSTGPSINRATLRGRVVGAARGKPVGGIDVFAYQATDSSITPRLRAKPDYRTQSGDDGRWVLNYLTPGEYFVIAVDDANRNKMPDDGEAVAVPSRQRVIADTTRDEARSQWTLARVDTLRPSLRTSRGVSQRRYELRFSEPVLASRPDLWEVADSASDRRSRPLVYRIESDPNTLFVVADAGGPAAYLLRAAVSDSADNVASIDSLLLRPASAPDTIVARFIAFRPQSGGDVADLLPWEDPSVLFSSGLADSLLRQRLTVMDTLGSAATYTLATVDNTLFAIKPIDAFDRPLSISVVGGTRDTVYRQIFGRIPSSNLGGISGAVKSDTLRSSARVEAYDVTNLLKPLSSTQPDSTGRFAFTSLPDGVYSLRAFIDENENGSWDGGRASPYSPPELITWARDTVRVRPRWDTVFEDTLKLKFP